MAVQRSKYKNPIDPETGKPKRGRPPKVTPVDTISGPQPQEVAVHVPVSAQPADPTEHVTSDLRRRWKEKMQSSEMLEIPEAYKKAYPDGAFCYATDNKESIAKYSTKYGYEIAQLPAGSGLPGQTDTSFKFGDAVLMVRPEWMKQAHNEARRERVLQQLGTTASSPAEREALRSTGGTTQFMPEEEHQDDPDSPLFLSDPRSRLDDETPVQRSSSPRFAATGTKYVPGGFSK